MSLGFNLRAREGLSNLVGDRDLHAYLKRISKIGSVSVCFWISLFFFYSGADHWDVVETPGGRWGGRSCLQNLHGASGSAQDCASGSILT